MKRGRLLLLLGVLLHPAALAWWLFGFKVLRLGEGTMVLHRSFGRVVRVDSDANGDGRMDEQFVYSWRRPMGGDERPRTILADANHDGRWDLWITFTGRSRNHDAVLRYAVDTDGDGRADWKIEDIAAEAVPRIRARRGF
ncbi:MAG TPA: hypothetical protein VEO54_20220 [Thermoanaerobaculia bacterium]|nr:hypothetical protein [Thermoanaerobaculia bacterium]